jgi:hypothetical protein
MKFTVNGRSSAPRPVRAFIDADGDLIIYDKAGIDHMCICQDGTIVPMSSDTLQEAEGVAKAIFFEGDEVTITF